MRRENDVDDRWKNNGLSRTVSFDGNQHCKRPDFSMTDVKGTIHFTDNPYSIPESIRNSSALIVRKDMDTKSHSS
jgi:hypothetical protein